MAKMVNYISNTSGSHLFPTAEKIGAEQSKRQSPTGEPAELIIFPYNLSGTESPL